MSRDAEAREELVNRTGRMTFPQIMVGDRTVGGFQELLAAHRAGTLSDSAGRRGLRRRRYTRGRGWHFGQK